MDPYAGFLFVIILPHTITFTFTLSWNRQSAASYGVYGVYGRVEYLPAGHPTPVSRSTVVTGRMNGDAPDAPMRIDNDTFFKLVTRPA